MTTSRNRRPERYTQPDRKPATPSVQPVTRAATSIQDSRAIPTRAVIAITGTALALALLLSFRTPENIPVATGGRLGAAAIPGPTQAAAGVTTTGPAGSSSSATAAPTQTATPSGGTTSNSRTTNLRSTNPPAATTAPAATVAPTATPTQGNAIRTASADVTGPVERTPFGDVQVEVKMTGGRIMDIIALQLPNDRRRSAQISQYVAPILHDEALQAQTAQIDLISGATWTSGAYQASLQGALDKIANG